MLYVTFQNLDKCRDLNFNAKMCYDILPLRIDSNTNDFFVCSTHQRPKTCQTTTFQRSSVSLKLWLITISDQLPITIKCSQREASTTIVYNNTVLYLQLECSAFVGTTSFRSRPIMDPLKNITSKPHPIIVPFQ